MQLLVIIKPREETLVPTWFREWDYTAFRKGRIWCPVVLKQQQQPCMIRKKVLEKVSFSRVLADNLCVLVTTPPSSNVPFSAHMLPIRQSDLHDVSVRMCVCVHAWGMAGKPVLLSRCERKGGKWGEQDGQKRVWRHKLTIIDLKSHPGSSFSLPSGQWCLSGRRWIPCHLYWHSQIISYPTTGPDTMLKPQFPHLLTLQRNPFCKHYYYFFSPRCTLGLEYSGLHTSPLEQTTQQLLSMVLCFNLPAPTQVGCTAVSCSGCSPNFLMACYSTWPLSDLPVAWALWPLKLRT